MIAIILNSGLGKRMGEITRDKPKCLVNLNPEDTILSRQIRFLVNNRITKIIITTGPFREKIHSYLAKLFPELRIKYVNNPKFSTTNYIYSLFLLSRDLIVEDVLLMHGDLVFDEIILKQVIRNQEKNVVLVNRSASLPEKDFKGRIIDGRVTEISVNLFDSNCVLLMPLYKLSKETFNLWLDEISSFIKKGKTKVYAEDALNKIADQIQIVPHDFNQNFCIEIDTPFDLEITKNSFK